MSPGAIVTVCCSNRKPDSIPECDASRQGQQHRTPIGVDDEGPVVSATRVGELSARGVVHGIEQRDEHRGLVVIRQEVVDLPEHFRRLLGANRRALQQRAARHHEEGRGHPLVRDIGDGEPNATIVQLHDVEEIAANVARGNHARERLEGRSVGEARRQDRLLHRARDIKLVLEHDQLVARGERLAPLQEVLQRALDGDPQVGEVEWLGDEVEGAAVHGGADVLHVAVGRDDDGADVGIDVRDLREQRQAVHLRHVDVGQHHLDLVVGVQQLERLDAVVREDELVVAGPDLPAHALQDQRLQVGLVVDDEDLVRLCHQLTNNPGPFAVVRVTTPTCVPAPDRPVARSAPDGGDGFLLGVMGLDDLVEAADLEDLAHRTNQRADGELPVLPLE